MTAAQLSALPPEINLTGFIESGEVFLNGKPLDPLLASQLLEHLVPSDSFTWGNRYGSELLAMAVLLQYLPVGVATDYYFDFKYKFVFELPQTDFDVTINLKKEIEEILNIKILK